MTRVAADPVDIVLNPSPQVTGSTCQSYSMGLAMSFHSASPFKAETPTELRELERRIRAALTDSATANGRTQPIRDDWRVAMEKVSNGKLTAKWRSFRNLDSALRFAGDMTGITNPEGLGEALSATLVKTPVMLSFNRIGSSNYLPQSHIVTVFGVQIPNATMGENAHPKLLIVNSAVKYNNDVKNICANEDLSDTDKYRATADLTNDYDIHRFGDTHLVTYVDSN
ncbi:MAG: hypothetical protein E5Y63_06190 [Mesorhizobium sp.]|uniref:hypothetical protein n=1 Tax=Mesorhizobium sp. TaxID=1871066 RepID=UPI0011F5EE26|nr:hypothetical protein [Mesorhizobium sp.]TIM31604.1 MAG: hypothetical protein E5Y63_06190 [Mesorhizobium sp.]